MATAKVIKGETIVELTLTEREAKALLLLVGLVTGHTEGPRGETSAVFKALSEAGISTDYLYAKGSLELPRRWPPGT